MKVAGSSACPSEEVSRSASCRVSPHDVDMLVVEGEFIDGTNNDFLLGLKRGYIGSTANDLFLLFVFLSSRF